MSFQGRQGQAKRRRSQRARRPFDRRSELESYRERLLLGIFHRVDTYAVSGECRLRALYVSVKLDFSLSLQKTPSIYIYREPNIGYCGNFTFDIWCTFCAKTKNPHISILSRWSQVLLLNALHVAAFDSFENFTTGAASLSLEWGYFPIRASFAWE